MPTPTHDPIANVTLTSAAGTVTFSNIPNTYRDLVIIAKVTATNTGSNVLLRANNASGATAYTRSVFSTNSGGTTSLSAGDNTSVNLLETVTGTTRPLQIRYDVMDYSTTNTCTSFLVKAGSGPAGLDIMGARWNSTAAVTTLALSLSGNTFSIGSTFALYGVIA